MRSTAIYALGTSLATVLVLLACAASDPAHARNTQTAVFEVARPARATVTALSGGVRIELRFRVATGGTFRASGAIADTGGFKSTRRVLAGRVQVTTVLAGRRGTIRLRALRPCAGGSGTWRVLSGTRAYGELTGRGSARGGPGCVERTRYPVRAVYTGTVRTPEPPAPLPPIAEPGQYGGATAEREEIVFEVAAGGRSIVSLRIQQLKAPCLPPTLTFFHTISMPGPYPIAEDGSFVIESQTTAKSARVAGRFTPAGAAGTAMVTNTFTDPMTGTSYTCSGSATWTVTRPPPAATPGRYCGFTSQGPGICLDVAQHGRAVTRVEVGVVVECQPDATFELTLTFTDVPIGAHLGFRGSARSFEGLVAGSGSVSGFFDSAGSASGGVGLTQASFDHEGTRYRCRNAGGRWEARRQA